MADLPNREDIMGTVRRNIAAGLLDQISILETDKAMLLYQLENANAEIAKLTNELNELKTDKK